MRGRVGLLAHDPLLYRDLTVRENLAFHARLHDVPLARAEALTDVVGLGLRADEPVRTLSRGMAQRAAICRAVLHAPDLLLLDEPTANLDPGGADAVAPLIGRGAGPARVLISHDVEQGLGEADRVLGLRGGPRGDRGGRRRRDARRRAEAVRVRRTVGALLRKDVRLELRAFESVPAMLLFSVSVLVLFHFGLDRSALSGDLASGVLWVTLLLASVLGMNRLFVADAEQGGFDGFLLAPVDRTALFVAKAILLFGFLVAVELVVVPAFALLLLEPGAGQALPELLAVLVARGRGHRGGRHARRRARRADPRA